jgi:hypothetical protein
VIFIVGCSAMNIVLGWSIFVLLVGVVASVAVRLAAALVSDRIRSSVLRHPVAHVVWLLLGLAALGLLLALILPATASRRVRVSSANNWVQATPGCAVLFVQRLRPGAPDPGRSAQLAP